MNQGRGLERLAGRFFGHLLAGELAQFIIDQRQQLIGGVRIAVLDRVQDASDLAHEVEDSKEAGLLPCLSEGFVGAMNLCEFW